MSMFLKLLHRILAISSLPIFTALANLCRDTNSGVPISKAYAKDLLVCLAAAGPMTKTQLAGVVGTTAGNHDFTYTFAELKARKAVVLYGKRGSTEHWCVNGVALGYVWLTDEERKQLIVRATSKKYVSQVSEVEVRRPPNPVSGQPYIWPLD